MSMYRSLELNELDELPALANELMEEVSCAHRPPTAAPTEALEADELESSTRRRRAGSRRTSTRDIDAGNKS